MPALICLCALALVGCAARTVYVPDPASPAASLTSVPYAAGNSPGRGMIQVRAFAAERLPVGPGAPAFYLRLRLAAENRQDDPWLFNPNDQLLAYNGGMLAPAYVQTSAGGPVLALGPGAQGWMDLFFPLPPEFDPLQVTLWWRFRRGGEITAHTTAFVLAGGRDPRNEVTTPIAFGLYMPGSDALGWWWPAVGYYDATWAFQRDWHDRGRARGPSEERESSSPSSNVGTPAESASSSAGNWRGAPDGPSSSSSSDAGKSAWRGGGR
jgi:hypothetical protein